MYRSSKRHPESNGSREKSPRNFGIAGILRPRTLPHPELRNPTYPCPGTGGTPRIGPLPGFDPKVGTVFQAGLGGMPPSGGVVFVALGTSETAYAPLGLPFDLGPVGAAGCRIWCSFTMLSPLPNIGGSGTYSLPIPAVPALVGARFYNQVLVPDAAANPFGVTFSNGARGVVR